MGNFLTRPLAALLLMPLAALAAKPEDVSPTRPLRVLFVGNSYIYTHDLPTVVAAVAAARGVALVPGMLAEPNFAIEDHLGRAAYAARLAEGWDWVVLQQGPSSLPENQINLRVHSALAADLARARGIKVALMSAWPALENVHTWANAELSYRNAATANGLCVLPVASAWRYAREQAPTIRLYQSDQLHPERDGTLLAALVLAQGLIDRPRFANPPQLGAVIPAQDWRGAVGRAALLDEFAREALDVEGPRCRLAK